jgi:CRISPR/Cas system CMR-associated protein Cmr5 small subunit
MIKKLLKKLFYVSSYNNKKNHIEQYLAQSKNLYDLENRLKEIDRKGAYNRFYI